VAGGKRSRTKERRMETDDGWVVVGLDNGGNKNNATVM
jgi:hypothetical protein